MSVIQIPTMQHSYPPHPLAGRALSPLFLLAVARTPGLQPPIPAYLPATCVSVLVGGWEEGKNIAILKCCRAEGVQQRLYVCTVFYTITLIMFWSLLHLELLQMLYLSAPSIFGLNYRIQTPVGIVRWKLFICPHSHPQLFSKCYKKANSILNCINRSIVWKSSKIILPLGLKLERPYLEYCV